MKLNHVWTCFLYILSKQINEYWYVKNIENVDFLVIIIIQRNERYSHTNQGRIQIVGVMNLR